MTRVNLEQVRIATQCSAPWENMQGEGAVRFCEQCQLNVYNLRDMTRGEAEDLINNTEGRVCARIFRRHDGTIITRDCPVGRRALHRQILAMAGAIAGALLIVGGGVLASAGLISRDWYSARRSPDWNWWRPTPTYGPEAGDVCIVPSPLSPPPASVPESQLTAEELFGE